MKQLARLFANSVLSWCLFFFNEFAIRVHTLWSLDAVPFMFSLHSFTKNLHSCGNWGCGFTRNPEGNCPLWFSLPNGSTFHSTIHLFCTRALLEAGFQAVVHLSLTCGQETDWIQKMEFESISLNISL